MKRIRIEINDLIAFDNLAEAAMQASRGKKQHKYVQQFFMNFEQNIEELRRDIITGKAPYGIYKTFKIYDPKERIISAVCFRDRIIHHAIIKYAGAVIDKAMVDTTFACRKGKGTLAAVQWVQACSRRFPFYVKIDIRKYFDSIDHNRLKQILKRRFKGAELLELFDKIIDTYETSHGKGLPIGALTSQYFANYYLDLADRFIMDQKEVCAHARYMDDIVWWCGDSRSAKETFLKVREFIHKECLLEVKEKWQINRSMQGISFCGFRIFPGVLKLGRRRRKRYVARRKAWEAAFHTGEINGYELQKSYAAVHAITAHSHSREWRRTRLKIHPPPEEV